MSGRGAALTVLLPARNAEALLPSWLEAVAKYADEVIALDDGSTDATRTLLESHPLVSRVLTNPRRDTYRGWDDLTNRQRLLDAAGETATGWLLFLDADERIDEPDGLALRHFLLHEARAGHAYGFRVFRMIEDATHFDKSSLWVYRCFAASDARTRISGGRLHFVPVPAGIPRENHLRTTIRIQHFSSLTAARRRERFEKYRESDPTNDFQADYTNLLAEPDPKLLRGWEPRSAGTPVLLTTGGD